MASAPEGAGAEEGGSKRPNTCWTKQAENITIVFLGIMIIILASVEFWVLFGRESHSQKVIEDVVVTFAPDTLSTHLNTSFCSNPNLLNDGVCNNEIRMEIGCLFDHTDCKHNPEKEKIAEKICKILADSEIKKCGHLHEKYPYCKPCGHPMKSW